MENLSWVSTDNFDPDKLSIETAESKNPKDMNVRGKIMYEYTPNAAKRNLVVTVPRVPDAYLVCRGVQKETYTTNNNTRVDTNRYGAQLVIEGDNEYHVALYQTFAKIIDRVADLTNTKIIFPAKEMDNYSIIYTNLIHSKEGKMYSTAYKEDGYLDILECGKCKVRPALLLSTLMKSATETKIRVQISQMYVYESVVSFPLATQD